MTNGLVLSAIAERRLVSLADALSVPDGGFTLDPRTGETVTTGYVLSIRPDCERQLTGTVHGADLLEYALHNSAQWSDAEQFIGAWRNPDDGVAYLDVSTVVGDLDSALSMAREHGQLAVFDMATGASVPVPAHAAHVVNRGAW